MGTLVLIHAHPDDEAISTGGVIMKAKAHGHRVVLVTATRGEAGEIYNIDPTQTRPRLAVIRTEELKAAGDVLGVDRIEFLGYRDSGMVDTPDNKDPRSFHQARIDEAASRLAVFLREERPDVVVTAHYVTVAALDLLQREGWSPAKVYYTAIPRSMMEEFVKQYPDQAERSARQNIRVAGTPDELITTRIDVHDYVDEKRKAFEAHVSQNDPDSWFAGMAGQILELALGTEYYQLARGKPGSELPESDLFAGVS